MITSLDRLAEGENATVAALKLDGSIRRRLLDLGMIEGTGIRCERYSPAGDPVLYRFRGTRIALRREDACKIAVEVIRS